MTIEQGFAYVLVDENSHVPLCEDCKYFPGQSKFPCLPWDINDKACFAVAYNRTRNYFQYEFSERDGDYYYVNDIRHLKTQGII